jgi:hypothetical protein
MLDTIKLARYYKLINFCQSITITIHLQHVITSRKKI